MKHLSLLLFLVCAACGALSPRALPQARAQELQSQKDSMVRVVQALDSVVATAKKVTGNAAFVKQFGAHGFNEEGCVFGVMLSPGASSAETFTLRKGQSYIFIGGGDQSARDIDLIITDSRGKVVNRNTNNNKTSPFARFDPPVTGRYTMTLKLQSSANGSAFCAVSVLRTGGVRLPLDRIVEAAAKVVAYSAIVFAAAEGGQFTRDRNTWAIYGAVLNSKQAISSDAKRYGNAKRGFFAVGDDRVKDLDLALVKSGGVVAQDTQSAGVPSILYGTTAGSAYSMQLSNNYSTGPALVMGVLIDVPANFSLKALEERAARQNGGNNNGDFQPNNSSLSGPMAGPLGRRRWRAERRFKPQHQRRRRACGPIV